MKKLIALSIVLTGCMIGAGTLGGFESISFPTSKQNVVTSIDSIFKLFPTYKVPDKWQHYDTWKERGYDFLDSRIFYFQSEPEEMYYVTFLGDANDSVQKHISPTTISVRAYMKSDNLGQWQKEADTRSDEKSRIQTRFRKEIVSKIETLTKTTVSTED